MLAHCKYLLDEWYDSAHPQVTIIIFYEWGGFELTSACNHTPPYTAFYELFGLIRCYYIVFERG